MCRCRRRERRLDRGVVGRPGAGLQAPSLCGRTHLGRSPPRRQGGGGGYPDRIERAGRTCADVEARKFVGGKRASSIFPTPVRGILDAASRQEASDRHREIDRRGFGAQSFAILPKIRQWDELLQADARARQCVREIHPEVSFAALNGGLGQGLVDPKRSFAGAEARVALLAEAFGRDTVMALVRSVPTREAATDDVLDALAALWSAGRIAAGCAGSLPSPVVPDATGLPAAIWY